MYKQNGYMIGQICFWGMVPLLLIGCLPTATSIEVERVSPEPTSTEEIIQFVNYVLPPQTKPTMKDFLDYEYFIPGSEEPIIPLICVSWKYNNFYLDKDFEKWYEGTENRVSLTVDGFYLLHWTRYESMLELIEIKDGHRIRYSERSIDCWQYKPILGDHQAAFSVERTSGEVSIYSWVFTVMQ